MSELSRHINIIYIQVYIQYRKAELDNNKKINICDNIIICSTMQRIKISSTTQRIKTPLMARVFTGYGWTRSCANVMLSPELVL